MGRGFDMVKGTQNGTDMGAVLLPVFKFNYDSQQMFPVGDTQYLVPDELVPTSIDSSTEEVAESIETTYTDYLHTLSKSFNVDVGVSVNVPVGGENDTKALSLNFKYNHESYDYHEKAQNSSNVSGASKHEWAVFQLEAYPPQFLTLDFMFEKEMSGLPATIASGADQAKYNQMVQYWGTHFPVMANFGGHVHVNTWVDQSFLSQHSASWAKNQFSLTFHFWMFDISGGGAVNRSDIHIDQSFKEASHTYIYFKGGDVTLQSNTTVDQWVASIPAHARYLNVTMSDLSVLVSDSTKAANLQRTIKSYITTGQMPPTDDSVDYQAFHDAIVIDESEQVARQQFRMSEGGRMLRGEQ